MKTQLTALLVGVIALGGVAYAAPVQVPAGFTQQQAQAAFQAQIVQQVQNAQQSAMTSPQTVTAQQSNGAQPLINLPAGNPINMTGIQNVQGFAPAAPAPAPVQQPSPSSSIPGSQPVATQSTEEAL